MHLSSDFLVYLILFLIEVAFFMKIEVLEPIILHGICNPKMRFEAKKIKSLGLLHLFVADGKFRNIGLKFNSVKVNLGSHAPTCMFQIIFVFFLSFIKWKFTAPTEFNVETIFLND